MAYLWENGGWRARPGGGPVWVIWEQTYIYIYISTHRLSVWQTQTFYLTASSVIQVTVQQERCLRTQPGLAPLPKVLNVFFCDLQLFNWVCFKQHVCGTGTVKLIKDRWYKYSKLFNCPQGLHTQTHTLGIRFKIANISAGTPRGVGTHGTCGIQRLRINY